MADEMEDRSTGVNVNAVRLSIELLQRLSKNFRFAFLQILALKVSLTSNISICSAKINYLP